MIPHSRELLAPELWQEFHEKYPDIYPPLTPEEARDLGQRNIRARYAKMMEEVVKPYHQAERETWFTQLAEAEAWMANNNASTPMLSAMAQARGISLPAMVTKVLENNALFRQAVGQILGAQQAELDALLGG